MAVMLAFRAFLSTSRVGTIVMAARSLNVAADKVHPGQYFGIVEKLGEGGTTR